MKIEQTGRFTRSLKHLHDNELDAIDEAVKYLATKPLEGVSKVGDLVGIRVYKLKIRSELKLLAYTVTEDTLTLVDYGTHENFYRDLKRHDH
jgi:mRNA interferase RelE/StbE